MNRSIAHSATRGLIAAAALAASATLALTGAAFADTVDVVLTTDGREFIGQIVSQDADAVVIKTTVAGIDTTLTLSRDEIAKVIEDQAVTDDADAGETDAPRRSPGSIDRGDDTFGVRRTEVAEGVAKLFIVPFHGQAGTDVRADIYRDMVDAIRAEQPDYIVIEVDCEDYELGFFKDRDPSEFSQTSIDALDDYRRLVDLFRDDLRDIPQVVWIKQAVGMASVFTLSWDTIYMKPGSYLEGGDRAAINFEAVKADADKYGKFREAYMGLMRGFALRANRGGGYESIVDAMMIPDNRLSATWRGRKVEWSLDNNGEYDVDRSDKRVAKFNARTAENFGISSGTAENLDDVALLLGLREYAPVGQDAQAIFDEYREDWRRTLERAETAGRDYQKWMSFAQGQDWLKYFGKAKSELEKVIRCIDQFEAVEIRLAQQGVQKSQLRLQIKQMEEQLAAYRRQTRGNGRRGGGGGTGFGGG